MTHVGYLVAGYVLTAVVLLAYVARLRWRSRALVRALGAGRQAAGEPPAPGPTGVTDPRL